MTGTGPRKRPMMRIEKDDGTTVEGPVSDLFGPYRTWIRAALGLGAFATIGVLYLALSGSDDTHQAQTSKGATTVTTIVKAGTPETTSGGTTPGGTTADPPAKPAGSRVREMERVAGTPQVSGTVTVTRASNIHNVNLQVDLDLDGGRGVVAFRSPTRGLHYLYDSLASGTQRMTWSRDTLRRFRSLVVIGHNGNVQRTVLHVPVYELLGGSKPATKTVRRLPVHPAAETHLHRLLLERTRGASRHGCYLRRSDRPSTASAQWACRIEGVPVRYLRFRTRKSMNKYAGWLVSTSAGQPTPNTRICPDGTVHWSNVIHNRRANGTVRLRRRPTGGLLLVITYPSRRSLVVAGTPTAANPSKVCKVWWKAA